LKTGLITALASFFYLSNYTSLTSKTPLYQDA